MYFEQFYLACLSHASYMIGSEGAAAVVDPQRDVGIYLEEAAKQGFSIRYIIETHLHADFVSGHQELAARTGAGIYLGARAGAKFPHVAVKDGDEAAFGRVKLTFLETPGHTLESISVVVTDLDRPAEPFCVLTGDTLFIGDVGRPDLGDGISPQELAGMLFDSLHEKLLRLPEAVQVYPAHGAGSLCGRQMSAERSSTIGRERQFNYALQPASKEEFVRLLTAELPERPRYFAHDVEMNRSGATPLAELPPLAALGPREVLERQRRGAVVLDTRSAGQFGAGHVPGAINIALSGQFASWAGILLGLDADIVLVGEDEEHVKESRVRLARVGIERVPGSLSGGIAGWTKAGFPFAQIAQMSVYQLKETLDADPSELQLIDVRRPAEWEEGRIAHAVLKPLHELGKHLDDLDPERPVAAYCKGGYRSAVAASLLRRAGFGQAINVTGGFDAWRACGLPAAPPARIAAPSGG